MNHLISAKHMTLEKFKVLSDNTKIYYQNVSPPVPLVSDRDMYLLEHSKKIADGEYQVVLFSIEGAPEVKKKVRATTIMMWQIKAIDETKTHCYGFSTINPAGSLPSFLAGKMSKGAGKQALADKKNIEEGKFYEEKKK